MKKTIKLIILAVFVLTLIFSQKSFAWQQGNLQDNKTTITVQSSYLGSSESTIAVALKSSNKFGENSNVLTKENLKNLIKEKYGKDIVSKIYKTDGTTEIADNEYVGTGYKVELLTNKKLTVILYGDVNSDGQINTNDTVAIAKYNVGANKLNEYQKKAAKLTNTGNYDISTNDSVRVAYYNVNGLGTNKAGKNIVDVTLYPADEKLSHNSQLKVLNVNNAEEEYKTALNTYTDGKFTANNSELKLENGKLTGTVKYNFEVGTELFPENELTGYYFAYVLKVAGANENTTVKIKNGSKVEKTILYESFDVTTAGKEGIVILTSLDKNENNKNVEIEIDLDGEGTLYAPVKQKINYEGLTFEDISQAAITMQIPEEDVEGLKGEVWNYRFEFKQEGIENQGYSIEKTEKNKYKATGIITEQKEVTGFSGDDKTDYYVVFAVEPTYVYDNIQIKIPRGNSYITVGKEALTDGKLTAIISVKEDNKSNPIKVLVDLDGSGNRFQEEEITIDYSKLELRKASTFNLENGKDYQKLKDAYGWKEPSEDYTATFTADTEKEDTVKVSGVIPYLSNWENGKESPFSGESKTGYYLALVINTDVNKKEETTVKIIDEYNNGTETKTEIATILGTSFDEESKLYVLKHLHLDDTSKTFTIEVDMDGEGKEYNPYTITVDWSELVLQQDSKAEINLDNASNKNKQEMSDWGYKTPDGQKVELTSENSTIYVSGKLIEQELTDVPFGEKSKDGYYFDFTISHPKGMKVNPENVKIKRVTEPKTNGEVKKEFTELDENNNLTILYRFDPETTSCTACKEKEKCDDTCCGTTDGKCDKQAYYVVDWDGEGKEFLPVVYTLDFCKLTFEKSSIFTVEALQESDKGEFGTDDGGAWYDTEHGYSVKVTQDEHDTTKYKVTGVLPIFDDTQDEEYNENFDTDNKNLYYLGLVLKLVNAPSSYIEGTGKMTVKFYHNEGTEDDQFVKAMGGDFDSSKELYILKALTGTGQDGEAIPDKEKVFTITIDLDGDDSEEFAPYTVTIDWSGLKLQDTSRGDFGNYDVIEKGDLTEESPEQKELNGYGFDYDADAEVSIKTETQEETQHESKKGLEGTIKEQTLDKGFKTNKGYFVPIKIEFPGKDIKGLEDYKNTWTLILNTEDGNTKVYKPTDEEYEQGWVMVLFRIEKEGKDSSKKISYKIDFDGDEFAFLPEEYTIDYTDLNFESENTITYNYKNNKGETKTETVNVYENEKVTLKDMSEENTDYRTFDGWYKEDENVSEKADDFKTGTNEAVTLTAHWKLNVDAFVGDVITNTADYSDVIDLEQAENVITMNIDKPKVELEELAKTAIPGTIAYILEKDEIKDVTLTIGDESVIFNSTYKADNGKEYTDDSGRELDDGIKNLKEEIVKGAKGAFDKELKNHEADATLDQLEYENKEFKIKISSVDDTVKLVDAEGADIEEADKTYTFKFDSDFAVVKQNPTSELGAKDLADAVKSDKDYSTVYVDGDYTSDTEIDITANHNVTIIPVDSTTEHPTTIKANDKEDVNYAVDIQNGEGTVTIKDLTITGGKRAELRIEDEATVIVDNIDVSGEIKQDSATTEEMNSSIIVKGNLTATNVKNTNESYNCPTISVITGYKTDTDSAKPEEGNPDHNVDGVATVKADGMTKNDKYCLVDRKSNSNFHTTKERYDGAFYYNDANHSKIYYVGIMDPKKNDHPYDYIQVYYYGEKIDIKTLGYEANVSPTADEGVNVFQYFAIGTSSSNNKIEDSNQVAQDKLKNHDTTILYAMYGTKPAAALNFDQVSGLSTSGNKVSGTISTQNKNGQFVIPVTLTSDSFKSGVSIVEVTDPNENKQTYTVDNANTMKLELEAIKSSKITGKKGKVYEITVDIDGKEKNEVKPETYIVDYSSVETLEEKINQAAKATLEANSFTVTKNNKINGYTEEFIYKYNANDGLTYLKAEKDNVEEYTFSSAKYAGVDSSKLSVVARKIKDGEEDSGVYLNDWVYVHPQQVGRAIHEVTMLTDVMKDSKTSINAIDTVELVDGEEHKYTVKLNGDKYTDWVKNNYLLTSKYTTAEWGKTVLVDVELDEHDKYIKSIKTHQESSNNTFDVTFKDVNKTTIEVPTKFLAEEGKTLTDEDIKSFYEAGKTWWEKHIYENAYKQQ